MKLYRVQMCTYFILQILLTSLCDEISDTSTENTRVEDLIDPHSFYYNRQLKQMQKPVIDEKRISPETTISTATEAPAESVDALNCDCVQKLQKCKDAKLKESQFELYYNRLLNMILDRIAFQEEEDLFKGNIQLKATISQMKDLRDFKSGKVSIRKIDSILSDIITPNTTFLEDAIAYSELILFSIQTHKYIYIGILLAVATIFVSKSRMWTRGTIIFLIIDLIIIVSFFMTWYQLIKEAEVKQIAKQLVNSKMPIDCDPDQMGMFQYIVSKVSFRDNTKECEEYFKARMIDPVAQVTPAQALSHMCTNFILHPMSLAGHMIGDFVENATNKMSWPMKWIVTLLLFIGIALVIIMLPFSIFGGSLGFGIGPLFHFNLSGATKKETRRLSNQTTRERIEVIREGSINVTHQSIEASSEKVNETTEIVELQLKNKNSQDSEETLSESASALVCFDKAKGDSATIDQCKEETCKLKLNDNKNSETKSFQEVGSGDS